MIKSLAHKRLCRHLSLTSPRRKDNSCGLDYVQAEEDLRQTSCSLGWDDTIVDGLYDVWGQFPEIVEISPESGVTKLFPSLEELKKIPFTPGDSREVCLPDLCSSRSRPNSSILLLRACPFAFTHT